MGAIVAVISFVLAGTGAILTAAEASGTLTASISPTSETVYFGCVKCTPTATFTFSGSGGSLPYAYFITWGDGSGQNLTNQTGNVTLSHTYIDVVATYKVTLKVVDSAKATASATAKVSVKQKH